MGRLSKYVPKTHWDHVTALATGLQLWTGYTAMKLRHLLLGRKAMTKLDSVLKTRDITLPTKVCIVKAMIFPLVIYGCESIRKDSDTGRDWGQEEKGTTEDEMAGWHH